MSKSLILTGFVILLAGCGGETREAATQYDTGAVVLDIADAEAFNTKLETTEAFQSAYEAMKAENYPHAEALLEQALQQKPRDPYALLAMGSVMERTGRFYRAAEYYKSAARYGKRAKAGPRLSNGKEETLAENTTVADVALFNLAALAE